MERCSLLMPRFLQQAIFNDACFLLPGMRTVMARIHWCLASACLLRRPCAEPLMALFMSVGGAGP